MNDFATLYPQLLDKIREMALHGAGQSMLEWDTFTTMPPAAQDYRSQVVAHFKDVSHRMVTAPEYANVVARLNALRLDGVIRPDSLAYEVVEDAWQQWFYEQCLPASHVAERNALLAGSYSKWLAAKEAGSWSQFLPTFTHFVRLMRRELDIVRAAWPVPEKAAMSRYDWLLDKQDTGTTYAKAQAFLGSILPTLISLRQRIEASPVRYGNTTTLGFSLSEELQEKVGVRVAEAIGFDFNAGLLRRTEHPFSLYVHPGYTGIATRYLVDDPLWSLTGITHEVGHGKYDQALSRIVPRELFGTRLGQQRSCGLHETQSRLWERMVGASEPFCHWLHQQYALAGVMAPPGRRMYEALNAVKTTHIRFEADEVTYNPHIAVRIECENAVTEGHIEPDQFFDMWREKTREYLGLEITSDLQGPLQDSHYSDTLGGFLGYALGNVQNAQLMAAAERDIPGLVEGFAGGKFAELTAWLNGNLYCHGGRYTPERQIEMATGEPWSAAPYLAHMEKKFAELYRL